MKFTFLTLFPEMIESGLNSGVVGQSFKIGRLEKDFIFPRDFTSNVHKTVDDRPFGGGDGMVMMAEPLSAALDDYFLRCEEKPLVVYMSPQGKTLDVSLLKELSEQKHILVICGRYGGIDQRFLNEYIDLEVSIGDYVLSGGELPAMVMVDSLSRLVPGVLGHQDSAELDSFCGEWGGLESPQFTRPRVWREDEVPDILLGGHHQKQMHFKFAVSLVVTCKKRPDLVEKALIDGKLTGRQLEVALKELLALKDSDWKSLGLDPKRDLGELKKWLERTKITHRVNQK